MKIGNIFGQARLDNDFGEFSRRILAPTLRFAAQLIIKQINNFLITNFWQLVCIIDRLIGWLCRSKGNRVSALYRPRCTAMKHTNENGRSRKLSWSLVVVLLCREALRQPNLRADRNHGFESSVVYIRVLCGRLRRRSRMLLHSAISIAILLDLVSSSQATRTAYVEIVFTDSTDKSTNTDKFEGTFANIGTFSPAQGDVWQVRAQNHSMTVRMFISV